MIDLSFSCTEKGVPCVLRPLSMTDRAAWGDAFVHMPYSPRGASLTMADNALTSILRGQDQATWEDNRLAPHSKWRYGFALERDGLVVGFAAFAGNSNFEDGITQTIAMMVPEFKGQGFARLLWNIAPVIFGDRLGYQSSTVQITADSMLRAATTELPAITETPGDMRPGRINSDMQFEEYTLPISEFIDGVQAGLAPRAEEWLAGAFLDADIEAQFPHQVLGAL